MTEATREISSPSEKPMVTVTVTPGVAGQNPSHDVAGVPFEVVQAVLWPLVILLIALIYRRSIGAVLAKLLGNLKSFSIAGVSVELAASPTLPAFSNSGLIDIRHSGTEFDVSDSTLAAFFTQIRSQSPLEFIVVNLGTGGEWLSSRLFILVVILMRMRGVRDVVFVDQDGKRAGHFVGVCSCEAIRWRLAQAFPRYEAALAAGEQRAWYGTDPPSGPIRNGNFIADDNGAFGIPDQAAELLKGFLAAVQNPVLPPPVYPIEPWAELTRTPPLQAGQLPSFFELATWINTAEVERLFEGALDVISFSVNEFEIANTETRKRLIVEHQGAWLALTRDQGRFYALVNRAKTLESLVVKA